MKFNLPSVRTVLAETGAVCMRFPYVVIAAVVGSGAAILNIEEEGFSRMNVIFAAAVGLPLMLTLKLLRERRGLPLGRAVALEAAGVAVLAGYACTFPAQYSGFPGVYWARFLAIWIGMHFVVAFAPCMAGAGEWEYWQFNRRLFQRFALAFLYTLVLYTGLTLALASLDKLLGLKIDSKRYADLWVVMAGIFNTLFFLGGVPEPSTDAEDRTYSRGLRSFAQFALAPLVAVFFAILYIYLAKIAITRSWPHGWVAKPTYFFAEAGILAALLLQPAREIETERWARWYWRNFFRALAPLAILLLLSMRERILAYGITELRYYGLVLGFWLLAVALYYSFFPGGSTRFIPSSLALILLLSAAGPWSASSVSLSSQRSRLLEILERAGAVRQGKLVKPAQPLGKVDEERLHSIVSHVVLMFGREELGDIVAVPSTSKPQALTGPGRGYAEAAETVRAFDLILDSGESPISGRSGAIRVHLDPRGIPLAGYRVLHHAELYPHGSSEPVGELKFQFAYASDEPTISFGEVKLDPAPLKALLDSIAREGKRGTTTLPAGKMSVTIKKGSREWLVVIDRIEGSTRPSGFPFVSSIGIDVLDK